MLFLTEDSIDAAEILAVSDDDETELVEVSSENWRSLLIGKDVKYKFSALFDQGAISGTVVWKLKRRCAERDEI